MNKKNNPLLKAQKYHKKHQKGMSPFCYLNPDGGNVPAGINFFNSTVSSDASAPTSGEGMSEGLFDNSIKNQAEKFVDNLLDRLYKDRRFDIKVPFELVKNTKFWNYVNDLCDKNRIKYSTERFQDLKDMKKISGYVFAENLNEEVNPNNANIRNLDDVLSDSFGNMSDEQLDQDIKLFNKIKRYFGKKNLSDIYVFVDGEGEYDPDSLFNMNMKSEEKFAKKVKINDIEYLYEILNGNTYIYSDSEENLYKYINYVNHMYDDMNESYRIKEDYSNSIEHKVEKVLGTDVWYEEIYTDGNKLVVGIDGDWKHDHLRADWLLKNNLGLEKLYTQNERESDSDSYYSEHVYALPKEYLESYKNKKLKTISEAVSKQDYGYWKTNDTHPLLYHVTVSGPYENNYGNSYKIINMDLVCGWDYIDDWSDRMGWADSDNWVDDVQNEQFTMYEDDSFQDIMEENELKETRLPDRIWHYDEDKERWVATFPNYYPNKKLSDYMK